MQYSLSFSLPRGARVGIVGSRCFPAAAGIERFVAALPPECVVVSGGARGADSLAAAAAAARGWVPEVHEACWRRYGRGAGPERNGRLVRSGLVRLYVFVPAGKVSAGSSNCAQQARRAGIEVVFVRPVRAPWAAQ